MITGFDHVILGVGDLAAAEAAFRAAGFHVAARADAQATDTDNRLVCFPDGSYLQIAALRDPAGGVGHKWAALMAEGDGWVDLALSTASADAVRSRLAAAGLTATEPRSSVRPLTDGRSWSIRVVQAGRGAGASAALPYFVEDTGSRDIRVPPPPVAQPGGSGVTGVTLLVQDLSALRPALEAIWGPSETVAPRFPGAAAALLLRSGGAWLEAIEPDGGSGRLQDHLSRRGEGVFEASIGLAEPDPSAPVLTLCGARLAIAPDPTASRKYRT
jgi:catechol 2,3-dioxygenase-like lactoylglutathione lyase family enzyme